MARTLLCESRIVVVESSLVVNLKLVGQSRLRQLIAGLASFPVPRTPFPPTSFLPFFSSSSIVETDPARSILARLIDIISQARAPSYESGYAPGPPHLRQRTENILGLVLFRSDHPDKVQS